MFQNDEYQYIGLTIPQLSEAVQNSSVLGEFILGTSTLSEGEPIQRKFMLRRTAPAMTKRPRWVRLNNISNFTYDTDSINQVVLRITPEDGVEYSVKVYKKFSTPEGVMLKTVKIYVDEPSLQYDTINYIQWRV